MSHLHAERISVPADEWGVELLLDHKGSGQHYVYTWGLAEHGIPEMFIGPTPLGTSPPHAQALEDDDDAAHELVRRAQWLVDLSLGALAGTVSTGQVHTSSTHGGHPVRFWMAPAEPPSGIIAVAIPDEPLVVPVRWSLTGDRSVRADMSSDGGGAR